ncbi:MAG: NUDIX domain-containing protein [Burkholderiaceae bacterium]
MLDKIDAGFLSLPEFERAVGALPLVSVDWVLLNPAGQMLLGHRRNAPARHWWFTPGGRVRKNEPLERCLQRVAVSELGLQASDVQGSAVADDVHPYVRVYEQWVVRESLLSSPN